MENSNDYLIHYGVLGMKWGLRKDRKAWEKNVKRNWAQEKAKGKKDSSYKKTEAYKNARSERLKILGAHAIAGSWGRNYMYGQYVKNGKSATETALREIGNKTIINVASAAVNTAVTKRVTNLLTLGSAF